MIFKLQKHLSFDHLCSNSKDNKVHQDQKMGVWSLQDGDEPLVLQLQELHYSIRGKLLEVVRVNMEVKPTIFGYLTSLSIFPIHLVYLIFNHNIYGAKYQPYSAGPLAPLHDQNVSCVVCYVSNRTTYLMIPAKITCPKT